MHPQLKLFLGLVMVMALLAVLDHLLARALGGRLERRVAIVAIAVPLLLLLPWLTSPIVLAPTNLLENALPGAPPLKASTAHDVLNDAMYQFVPWELEIRHALKEHRLPLWSEILEGGSSPWVNPQAGVLSPLVWFSRVFEIQHFLLVMIALKVEHALLGAWLLCRRVGVRRDASLLAAIGFSICGAMTAWGVFPHTTALAWVPWLIFAVIELLRGHKRIRIAGTAAVTAGLLLSGHPEVAAAGGLFAAVAGLSLRNRRVPLARSLGVAALAAILGFGMAAPLLVPFAMHLPHSQRAQETVSENLQTGEWSLLRPGSWFEQIGGTLMVAPFNPHQFGRPYEDPFTGTVNWPESLAGYPGIAALIGAVIALVGPRRRRAMPFVLFFIVSLLLAANTRPLVEILDLVRPLRMMAWTRFLLPGGLAIWVAAALGFDGLARRVRHPALSLIVAVVTGALILKLHFDISVLLLVLSGIAGVVLLTRAPRFGMALLVAMTLFDLFPWSRAQFPQGDPALFYPRTDYIARLQDEVEGPDAWRAVGEDWAVFPSLLPVFGVAETRPHNPLAPMNQVIALTHAFGFNPSRDDYFPPFRNAGHPLLDFLNVRAVVWNSPTDVPARFERIDNGQTPAFRLYRNPDALPRWFLPTRVSAIPRDAIGPWIETLDDARHVAVPDNEVTLPVAESADRLERKSWRPGLVELGTSTAKGALVATSLPWPEGWRAFTGTGERLDNVVVNGAFFGFVVPAGEQVVTLRFVPPGFWVGMWVGVVSALVCAGLVVPLRRYSRPANEKAA